MGGNEMQREKERVAAIMQQKQAAGKSRPCHILSLYWLHDLGLTANERLQPRKRRQQKPRVERRSRRYNCIDLTGSLVSDAASAWVLRG